MNRKFLYVYNVVEHELGWGTRFDGYMCFLDSEKGHEWVQEKYSKRNFNQVPECYDTYENGRWEPVHETLYEKVLEDEIAWASTLDKAIKHGKKRIVQLTWELMLYEEDIKLTDDELFSKYLEVSDLFGTINIK